MDYRIALALAGVAFWTTGAALAAWPSAPRLQAIGGGEVLLAVLLWLSAVAIDRTGPLDQPGDCNAAHLHQAEASTIKVGLTALVAITAIALINRKWHSNVWYRLGVVVASATVIVGSLVYLMQENPSC